MHRFELPSRHTLAELVGLPDRFKTGPPNFKALKVKNLTTARASRPGAQGRSIESFIWFAPGVGIIKVATGGNTDLELLKVERPATAKTEPAAAKGKKAKKL
jgi:hypothetical protein